VDGSQPAIQTQTKKPMTPQRVAWLKARCAQLVAFYDRWGVGRGENSDGPRNHTRIGAALECAPALAITDPEQQAGHWPGARRSSATVTIGS
jgi:hypothetical protein